MAIRQKNKMKIKEAIELCEEDGWEVNKGRWFLDSTTDEDKIIFKNDKELIEHAEMLKKESCNE